MRFAKINTCDLINTMNGVALSLWTQGCPHHCNKCFNPETWDSTKGKEFTNKEVEFILDNLKSPYVEGLSILGGEPFAPYNAKEILQLIHRVRETLGNSIRVMIWTGYTYEYLKQLYDLSDIDYIIDGKFMCDNPTSKKLRGSDNQRLIDIKKDKIID